MQKAAPHSLIKNLCDATQRNVLDCLLRLETQDNVPLEGPGSFSDTLRAFWHEALNYYGLE